MDNFNRYWMLLLVFSILLWSAQTVAPDCWNNEILFTPYDATIIKRN